MNKKNERATANLRMLEFAARKLGTLNNDVVYLGGCTTALFITDPLSLDVRPTQDVDCIVDIISKAKYYEFSKQLKKQGFRESSNDDILCRWHCDDIILDVMPIEESLLGFGNRWYKEAIKKPISHELAKDLIINSVTPSYFLVTKIEAFNSRGKGDYFESHDFEDIITLIEGRAEIVDEIQLEERNLRGYLQIFFEKINEDNRFKTALPGHFNGDSSIRNEWLRKIETRIKKIIGK